MKYRKGTLDDPVKPKGYRKPKSRLKAQRSHVNMPTASQSAVEASIWLRGR